MSHQHQELSRKEHWNIAHNVFLIHQRAVIIPMRDNCGKNFLHSTACGLALALQFFWAAASQDVFFYGYIFLWLCRYARHRIEAKKHDQMGNIPTYYDGTPQRLGSDERKAKLYYEPILVGILGLVLFFLYDAYGWPIHGLPMFFLAGCISLPVVEVVRQAARERVLDGMHDARLEQESLASELRDKYGH